MLAVQAGLKRKKRKLAHEKVRDWSSFVDRCDAFFILRSYGGGGGGGDQAFLEKLPAAQMYEKSYMHRDTVTHV
jgi:hypothetical protein